MQQRRALAYGLAVLWGAFATWIFEWFEVPVIGALFRGAEPVLKILWHNGWTGDQILLCLKWVADVLPALLYGLIFGFPLGLFIRRSIVVTWAIFVVAFVATVAVRTLLAQVEIVTLIGWLVWPIYWLTMLATLMFLFLGRRLRSTPAIRRAGG